MFLEFGDHFIGLDPAKIAESRARFGSNALTPQKSEGFLDKLWSNFQDPTIVILIVALIVVIVLSIFGHAKWYEGVGIAFAVVIATGVATWSEYKSEDAFQSLLDEASRIQVKVFRSGSCVEVGIEELVVGDFVLLQPGDKIPADGVIVAGTLQVDQAPLTGEAEPVSKVLFHDAPSLINGHEDVSKCPHGDLYDSCSVFRGSVVTDGEAVANLTEVGDLTLYGKLAAGLRGVERDSPLRVKLKALADSIGVFGGIGAVLIAVVFMLEKLFSPDERGLTLETVWTYLADASNLPQLFSDVVTAVILAVVVIVVAVPEGLPMMVAIVLSSNMRRLLADNVLVRKLLGIEAAGSLNILFSDKTGTLTKGELQVSTFVDGDCCGYSSFVALSVNLRKLVALSIQYNTMAVLDKSHGKLSIVGADRTEYAMLRYIESGLDESGLDDIQVDDFISFSSARKFSAVCLSGCRSDINCDSIFDTGFVQSLAKGAPELLLAKCSHYWNGDGDRLVLDSEGLDALNVEIDTLAGRSMRLLALATSEVAICSRDGVLPDGLTLIGIIGLRDDLRDESRAAVLRAQKAGIQVVMVTGDRKETAHAIALDAGLMDRPDALVLTSHDIEAMSDVQLQDVLPTLRVVSRAYPHTKSRLVEVSQKLGLVVGMTGDGVNDAAALKMADVGFSMGSGTEIAKEASDIVVLDNNFSSITSAVLYGRTLFKSIRKFLVFQLTVNFSAIFVAFMGPFFGFDLPLTMVQLLWINVIMDSLAALAISGETALELYMSEPPIPRGDSLITRGMWSSILFNAATIALFSLFFLNSSVIKGLFPDRISENDALLSAFFAFFVFINTFNAFNVRTEHLRLFEHILENRNFLPVLGLIFAMQFVFTYVGGEVLRTVGLTAVEWLYVFSFAIAIIPIDMLRKLVSKYCCSRNL